MSISSTKLLVLVLISTGVCGEGIGKAWRVSQYPKPEHASSDHFSWPRLDSSAFEVRSVSGVGRLAPIDDSKEPESPSKPTKLDAAESNAHSAAASGRGLKSESHLLEGADEQEPFTEIGHARPRRIYNARLTTRLLALDSAARSAPEPLEKSYSRVRRDAENETRMEQISTIKTAREARPPSPESWSTQPLSVEFRHRPSLDQLIQQDEDEREEPAWSYRSYHAPRTDFVTSHRRVYGDSRESRGAAVSRIPDDYYDLAWYRNTIRERDYDAPSYRYGHGYHYPERYRTDRDYYAREPAGYLYDRYRDDDLDLYGRSRPTPKPKRIIYYATLPEVVRKPVDMRSYPRPYDGLARTPIARDGAYKRVPGNVDPGRYRYRQLYDGYDPYAKRSSLFDGPYATYRDEEDARGKPPVKESPRDGDELDRGQDRKLADRLANQLSVRDTDGKLPWPVQVGTEVSVKDDERIPGRKIFGEANGYERLQSAQAQKAPDATGSSELRDDN